MPDTIFGASESGESVPDPYVDNIEFPAASFGQRVIALRQHASAQRNERVTQERLAAELGLEDKKTVARWEKGTGVPKGRELMRLSEWAGGVSLDWLVFGDGGDAPVYRNVTKPEAALEEELIAYLRRQVRDKQQRALLARATVRPGTVLQFLARAFREDLAAALEHEQRVVRPILDRLPKVLVALLHSRELRIHLEYSARKRRFVGGNRVSDVVGTADRHLLDALRSYTGMMSDLVGGPAGQSLRSPSRFLGPIRLPLEGFITQQESTVPDEKVGELLAKYLELAPSFLEAARSGVLDGNQGIEQPRPRRERRSPHGKPSARKR